MWKRYLGCRNVRVGTFGGVRHHRLEFRRIPPLRSSLEGQGEFGFESQGSAIGCLERGRNGYGLIIGAAGKVQAAAQDGGSS